MLQVAVDAFREEFGREATIAVAAPGRVNLIGEHTDYNGGFVLPMALPMRTIIVGCPAPDAKESTIVSWGSNVDEPKRVTIPRKDEIEPGKPKWANYVKGVFKFFPGNYPPCLALICSDVPLGAGLSSSASLEVATFTFLEALSNQKIPPKEKALLCQKAEHIFASVPCGIMDQFISTMGQAGHALLLDCRSMETKSVPLDDPDVVVFISDSNVKHELSGSEYPKRRKQCETAAGILGKETLRDASVGEIEGKKELFDEETSRRVRHVVTEIKRTTEAAEALLAHDYVTFGKLMTESHNSLKDDYEVSCGELDQLVKLALEVEGVFGSRMTGGGFGGCTVTLVKKKAVDRLKEHLAKNYSGDAKFYVCQASDGASRLDIPQ